MPAISCDYSTDARACAAVTKTLRLVGSRRVRRLLHVGGGAAVVRAAADLVGIPAISSKDGVIPQRPQDYAGQRGIAGAIGRNNPYDVTVVGEGDSSSQRGAGTGGDVSRKINFLAEEHGAARYGQSGDRGCLVDVLRKYRRGGASDEIGIAAVHRGDGVRAGKQRRCVDGGLLVGLHRSRP